MGGATPTAAEGGQPNHLGGEANMATQSLTLSLLRPSQPPPSHPTQAEGGQPAGGGVHAAGQHDHRSHGGRGLARPVRRWARRAVPGLGLGQGQGHARVRLGWGTGAGHQQGQASSMRLQRGPGPGTSVPKGTAPCCLLTTLPPTRPRTHARAVARSALLRCHPPPNMHKMVELTATAHELGFELDTSGAGGWLLPALAAAAALRPWCRAAVRACRRRRSTPVHPCAQARCSARWRRCAPRRRWTPPLWR